MDRIRVGLSYPNQYQRVAVRPLFEVSTSPPSFWWGLTTILIIGVLTILGDNYLRDAY